MPTGTIYPNTIDTTKENGRISFDVTFESALKCGLIKNAIFVKTGGKTKEERDAIPVDNTTTNNSNSNNKNIKGDSGMPIDVTFKPPLKCGQLESAIFVTNNNDNKKKERDVIPVKDTTTNKSNDNNKKVDKGTTHANNANLAKTTTSEATKCNKVAIPVKNNMYYLRASPLFIHEINSKSTMVNDLMKRAISTVYRHDLNLRPGHLNN